MKRVSLASCLLSLCVPGLAHAATAVYPGCAVPNLKAGHRTFYVDPVKGTPDGDGSAAKPWKTLAEVLDPAKKLLSTQGHQKAGGTDPLVALNPNGPIKAGDVIMLMSGDHGAVNILNATNSDFVTVMAAPGQTPVIGSLSAKSAAKWVFQGIKFQTPASDPSLTSKTRTYTALAAVADGWFGGSRDFVFTNDSFSTTDNTSGWSPSDWLQKPQYTGFNAGAPCTSITDSHIYNVLNGIAVGQQNTLVQGNTIEQFVVDGIDVVVSNATLRGNVIKGNVSPSKINAWHPDGIQGWSQIVNGAPVVNTNVVIDSNTIIKTGDPTDSWMQGISIFDGRWNGLTIQNNVVVTDHWHGIAVLGADKLRVLNNTVLASNSKDATWILVGPAKDGRRSTDVIVRNNVSTNLVIGDSNVVYDHNAVGGAYSALVSGKSVSLKKSDSSLKILVDSSLQSQLVNYNPDKNAFDVRLRPTSSLIGFGTTLLAPSLDITGKKRSSTVEPGAYTN